jgi:hypothetical protein
MYGQNNFMNSLGGGQRPGAFGDLENRLSEEEKKMLQEFIREEIEKNKQEQGGIPPMGGRGMY